MDPTFNRALRITGYVLAVVGPLLFAGAIWAVIHGYEFAWPPAISAVIGTALGIAYIWRANRARSQAQQADGRQ